MGFGEAISAVLNKYAVFTGRSRRSEYWWWALALFIVDIVIGLLFDASRGLGYVLYFVFVFGLLIPNIAVSVRRLHDTGRTGWWLLIGFIPIVGAIILIVFLATDSTPGDNRYGPSPKAMAGPPPATGPAGYAPPPPPPAG